MPCAAGGRSWSAGTLVDRLPDERAVRIAPEQKDMRGAVEDRKINTEKVGGEVSGSEKVFEFSAL